jgi:outer membrane protein OmpA-like peptidoglycan-associated protein
VTFTVTHPDYVDGTCAATIPAEGGDVETLCELEQRLVVVEETEVQLYQQIHFAFDRADILPESFALMQQIANVLRDNPQLSQIEIQGHTDDVGTRRYNLDLSHRRANAVRDWLVNAGVDAARLTARGYGMDRPIVQGRTEEARARNRRVQFVIQVRTDRGPGAAQPPPPQPPPP